MLGGATTNSDFRRLERIAASRFVVLPRYDHDLLRRLPVAVLVALLAVPTLTSSARAQSAWVLWADQKRSTRGGVYERVSLEPVSNYATIQECAATLDRLQTAGDQRWGPATLYRFAGDPKVEVVFIAWQCLPASVDPRTPAKR